MRCLIIGGSGFLGTTLERACVQRGFFTHSTGYSRVGEGKQLLDVCVASDVTRIVSESRPDITFFAAGPSSSTLAELNPMRCRSVLVEGINHVAQTVKATGGRVVYCSSDEVFGECTTARREADPLAPISTWARCQAEAESVLSSVLPNRHLIVRSGWVFGPEALGNNPASWLNERLSSGQMVMAANDRHGQPTFASDWANAILDLLDAGQTGAVHIVGPDRHTEFSFARLLAHVMGYDCDLIESVPSSQIFEMNPRPERVWLDRMMLRRLLGSTAIRSAGDGIRAMKVAVPKPVRVAA